MVIIRFLLFIILVYLSIMVLIYLGQRYLEYSPNKNYPGKPADEDVKEMREIRVKTEDGLDLLAWFAPPKKKDGKIIVFYHGNAGHIGHRAYKIRYFLDAGYGVYLCEYRGYGGNPGSISEEGLYQDARAGLKWLESHGYAASQWVLYGESIGSGPAVQMALEFQPKTMILEGAFNSALDVAERKYFWLPLRYLMKDTYDNISKIKAIRANLLMLHGDEDPVVPYLAGKKLYDAANHQKQFVTIEGGHHNDLYEHHAAHIILDWLKTQP